METSLAAQIAVPVRLFFVRRYLDPLGAVRETPR